MEPFPNYNTLKMKITIFVFFCISEQLGRVLVLNPEHTYKDLLTTYLRAIYDTVQDRKEFRKKFEKQQSFSNRSEKYVYQNERAGRTVYEESQNIYDTSTNDYANALLLSKGKHHVHTDVAQCYTLHRRGQLVAMSPDEAKSAHFVSFRAELDDLRNRFCDTAPSGRSVRISKRTLCHLELKDYLTPEHQLGDETERSTTTTTLEYAFVD